MHLAGLVTRRESAVSESPPTQPAPADPQQMLLEYLRERDVSCPRCTYNLRNLTTPLCPECREPLQLNVTVEPLRIGWLIASIVPCAFCLIGLSIYVVISIILGGPGRIGLEEVLTLGFMGASSIEAILLVALRSRFVRMRAPSQAMVGILTWTIHLLAFFVFVASIA